MTIPERCAGCGADLVEFDAVMLDAVRLRRCCEEYTLDWTENLEDIVRPFAGFAVIDKQGRDVTEEVVEYCASFWLALEGDVVEDRHRDIAVEILRDTIAFAMAAND